MQSSKTKLSNTITIYEIYMKFQDMKYIYEISYIEISRYEISTSISTVEIRWNDNKWDFEDKKNVKEFVKINGNNCHS